MWLQVMEIYIYVRIRQLQLPRVAIRKKKFFLLVEKKKEWKNRQEVGTY